MYPKDERGFLEEIFPEEMKIFRGKIIRIVPPTVYPIDIYTMAEILKGLIEEVLEGRPKAQFCAAEALGFTWICLTSARRRLPTELKLISKIPSTSLILPESPENLDEKKRPLLKIPSLYDSSPVPISPIIANYLNAIRNIFPQNRPILLQSHPRSLKRVLDHVLKKLPSTVNLGKITFLTFLSHPHEAINQR